MTITKEEKLFLILINLNNRNFMSNSANFLLFLLMVIDFIFVAGLFFLFMITGFNFYFGIVSLSIAGIMLIVAVYFSRVIKDFWSKAKKFNEQYQKYYLELYSQEKQIY